jgi:antitoxin ParD1/3/4
MSAENALKVNVRVSGALKTYIEQAVGDGDYENVSEYVRDLIRKDKARTEQAAFERVRAQLQAAFAAPDDACERIGFDDIKSQALARS